ncbi:c-type cytochrome [Marinifilum sp. D737]|uniref:c-type cytochrome n=1 Tax=Marinifilum sp. D737 TaxID=2969628 RepID=UPI0022770346|nr:cytochrome c [Marinifilum sp. D737]MCY1635351.1 cytochrome c [Marinifilum sp. D737]
MKNPIKILLILLLSALSLSWIEFQVKPWKVPGKYLNLKNPYVDKTDTKFVGKTLYKIHCSSCHGKQGLGDGVKAKRLKSAVPDFSLQDFQKQKDGELYFKSFIGRDEMPNFEKKIHKEEERWLLVNYMRTLKKE